MVAVATQLPKPASRASVSSAMASPLSSGVCGGDRNAPAIRTTARQTCEQYQRLHHEFPRNEITRHAAASAVFLASSSDRTTAGSRTKSPTSPSDRMMTVRMPRSPLRRKLDSASTLKPLIRTSEVIQIAGPASRKASASASRGGRLRRCRAYFSRKMDRVVGQDPERHRRNDRRRQTDLADGQVPDAERNARGQQVRDHAQQAERERAQEQDHQQRDQRHAHDLAGDHREDVALADVREHQRRAGAGHAHGRGHVLPHPGLRPLLETRAPAGSRRCAAWPSGGPPTG